MLRLAILSGSLLLSSVQSTPFAQAGEPARPGAASSTAAIRIPTIPTPIRPGS